MKNMIPVPCADCRTIHKIDIRVGEPRKFKCENCGKENSAILVVTLESD